MKGIEKEKHFSTKIIVTLYKFLMILILMPNLFYKFLFTYSFIYLLFKNTPSLVG